MLAIVAQLSHPPSLTRLLFGGWLSAYCYVRKLKHLVLGIIGYYLWYRCAFSVIGQRALSVRKLRGNELLNYSSSKGKQPLKHKQ